MKKKFLVACALLGVLTVSGCKDKKDNIKSTLSAPNQIDIIVDDGRSFIVFDEVPGAEYYNVSINGDVVTVRANGMGQIQFDASKLMGEPKDYVIKVNAGSANHFTSKYSDEYVYTLDKTIDAPVITKDGTTLNWAKVSEADLYEVFVTTPISSQSFKSINNSFNFEKMLTVCGEYSFYVVAISQNGQTVESLKSNDIIHIHTQTLLTPHNLKIEYDSSSSEEVLTFVSSEDVEDFEININNHVYTSKDDVNNPVYWKQSVIKNVYIFRIGAFARNKQISIGSGTLLNVRVKANSTKSYLENSQFSDSVSYQVKLALEQPKITTSVSGSMCNLTIQAKESEYLSQFAIYFDDKIYQKINANITNLQIPCSIIGDSAIRIQAISNNNNCYDSNLSEGKYADGIAVNSMTIKREGTVISWDAVAGATNYLVEISNDGYRKVVIKGASDTSCDILEECEPGVYNVRVITFGQNPYQSNKATNIAVSKKLKAPTDLEFKDNANLYFTPADNADGYVLTIKHKSSQSQQYVEKTIPYLFVSSPIDVSDYMIEAQGYEFKLKSIDLLNSDNDSELTNGQSYKNVKTLTAPKLEIIQEGKEFYLKITPSEDEAALITKYEVWIDYIKFDALTPDENGRINVTSHLQNAGLHNFMVKALATDNEFLRDSSMVSIPQTIYKQLDKVENITVNHPSESKYTLSFDGPVMAGSYNIKIIKADDPNYNVEIPSPSSFVDISEYVRESGVYRIYIQAMARQADEYYRSSEITSYVLTKGETLHPVTNIKIEKDKTKDQINLSWDSVTNSTYYRVQVYYNSANGKVLSKEIIAPQSSTPKVNLVSSEQCAIGMEGAYSVEIRAVGNDVYESSSVATATYNHTMETIGDFERNKVFVEGSTYSYKVSDVNTLKHLLWQHYLYNNQTWAYDTINYNLKVYCDLDLAEVATQVGGIEADIERAANKVEKMNLIATELLKQYKEVLSYKANYNSSICVDEKDNIYIFSYQNNIAKTEATETANNVYTKNSKGEKLDVVDKFNKRLSSNKFAIDSQESVDVTTTEQLFMALQYNKQPNFVGDSAVAEAVYENVRYILRQICSNQMSDYEKVLSIYNFLTKRVAWNYEAENKLTTVNNNASMQELYLESILYNTAKPNGLFTILGNENYSNNLQISSLNEFVGVSSISQGLSKAFVVLCSIEGIDSIKVNGSLNGKDYSWNKVYIDIKNDATSEKQWYAIDIGSAIKNKIDINGTQYQASTHRYFLVEDSKIVATEYNHHNRLGDVSHQAVTEFDYYSYQQYQCEYNNIEYAGNMEVDGGEGIKELIKYAMIYANNQTVVIDVDAADYFSTFGGQINVDTVKSKINELHGTAMQDIGLVYTMSLEIIDNRYIIFAFEPFIQ